MSTPITGELIVLVLSIIGGVAALWWRIDAKFAAADEARALLQRELAEYKVFVAQNHVSAIALRETEQRLSAVMEKLASRLEAIVGRLDEIAGRK